MKLKSANNFHLKGWKIDIENVKFADEWKNEK